MSTFNVPTKSEVSNNNQAIFDQLEKAVGFVPNLYATYAHSDTALENFLNFANAKTSLSNKEKEAVNLAVSQVNNCSYCLAAHTAMGKMNGDAAILEAFFGAGYSKGSLVDVISLVGEKTISNYIHNATKIPVDFPEAQAL